MLGTHTFPGLRQGWPGLAPGLGQTTDSSLVSGFSGNPTYQYGGKGGCEGKQVLSVVVAWVIHTLHRRATPCPPWHLPAEAIPRLWVHQYLPETEPTRILSVRVSLTPTYSEPGLQSIKT